jgi:predicted dehydrogenase
MLLFKPVRVGLIGCGANSSTYLSLCRKFDVLQLYACADLEFHRAEARAELFNIPNVFTVDEMLQDKKVQLILNLTPAKAHAKINLAVVQAKKHLYSDFPLGLTQAETQEVLAEGLKHQVLVGCGPDAFFNGGWQTARKLIDDDVIGTPLSAVAFTGSGGHEEWHPDPEFFYQPGGGPMLDTGIYALSALVHLLGPVARVCGSAKQSSNERTIQSEKKRGLKFPVRVPTHHAAILDFTCGTIGTLIQSYDLSAHQLPSLEIHGTKGTLSLSTVSSSGCPVKLCLRGALEWEEVTLTHPKEVGRGIGLADMAYAITHERPHRAHGQLSAHLLEIILALEEANRSGHYVNITSSPTRPAQLPPNLPPNELDF